MHPSSKSRYRPIMKRFPIVFALVFSLLAPAAGAAGFYVSTELGVGIGTSLKTDSRDTDFPTLCDRVLDPNDVFTPTSAPGISECPAGDNWGSNFGSATGLMAGAALGYRTDLGVRVEAEYFRVAPDYSETSSLLSADVSITDKLHYDGYIRSEERIGSVSIDSFFANFYYDVPVSGSLRPYLGGGLGVGVARIGYDCVWARSADPARIQTAVRREDYTVHYDPEATGATGNEETDRRDFHRRLAGTTTTASRTLRDTVFGYQAVIGVDYMLTDKTSIGIKGRWVKYSTFKDGGNEWDQLRSHPSNNGPGTHTVLYTIETDDLSAFGASIVMKYAF